MSNRERWTVYPLLFLTLGIVLKDKVTKILNADVVYCKTLVVTDRDHRERVVVSSNPAGGIVKADNMLCKALVVTDGNQHERVVVSSTAAGGLVKAASSNERLNVLLGHTDKVIGLMFTDGSGNLLQPSFNVRPPVGQPPEPDGEAPSDTPPPDPEAQQPGAESQEPSPPVDEERPK